MMNKRGLYVHIPFCKKICTYCDFVKRVSSKEKIEEYINALILELELYQKLNFDFSSIETIYIGGGTPSSISISLLEKLFKKIYELVKIENIKEFNFEINPEDLNQELINLLVSYNVNRVSIGIQSLNPKILKFLNRDFEFEQFRKHYYLLKEKINNINFDLMYAIPNQTTSDLKETIKKLLELEPSHFSIYSLILEEKTVMNYLLKKGQINLIDEEKELEMIDEIGKLLFPIYNQYEVSNYSLPNCESKHNIIYWENREYLGVGLGASGFLKNIRYTNTVNLNEYLKAVHNRVLPTKEKEELSIEDDKKYHLMLGFRMLKGIDIFEYEKKYDSNIFADFPKINEFLKKEYLLMENNCLKINVKYLYVMNRLLVELL